MFIPSLIDSDSTNPVYCFIPQDRTPPSAWSSPRGHRHWGCEKIPGSLSCRGGRSNAGTTQPVMQRSTSSNISLTFRKRKTSGRSAWPKLLSRLSIIRPTPIITTPGDAAGPFYSIIRRPASLWPRSVPDYSTCSGHSSSKDATRRGQRLQLHALVGFYGPNFSTLFICHYQFQSKTEYNSLFYIT